MIRGSRNSFVLLELIIVVFIMSLMFSLVIVNFERSEKERIDNIDIKSYLQSLKTRSESIMRLVCNTENCTVLEDFTVRETTNLFDDVKFYEIKAGKIDEVDTNIYDSLGLLYGNVRFSYKVSEDSSLPIFLQKDDVSYLYEPFLGEYKKFASLEDAQESLDNLKKDAQNK